jgi:hypothetical protein
MAARKRSGQLDCSKLEKLPITFQEIVDFFDEEHKNTASPVALKRETMKRIEQITGRPLICYATQVRNPPEGAITYIEDGDLAGWDDLVSSADGENVDVFIVSNGGSAEATERIVELLRSKFKSVRFIVPHNAYSAATLMCFSGDEILMGATSTLGPIDPQVNGRPARAILRGVEKVDQRLKEEGPESLPAYLPLLGQYTLDLLEFCMSAQELSEELARQFLKDYMLRDSPPEKIEACVHYFSDYDLHHSHSRGIYRRKAREHGLKIVDLEDNEDLSKLVKSLYNQFDLWFDRTGFYKMFENARDVSWGRQLRQIIVHHQEPPQQKLQPQ